MEIINEKYILIMFEFNEKNRISIKEFRSILMGNDEEINVIEKKRNNFEVHNVPFEINNEFIKKVKTKYKEDLETEIKYLYPIDFSIIKRVTHTFKVGERTRYINKPAGIMCLFKYMGPLTYIKEFLKLLEHKLDAWKKQKNDVFYNINNLNLILGSESRYIEEIINQNYFLLHFEFCSEKADPNDFRRALLGLSRISKGKEIPFRPNVPAFINSYYKKKIEEIHGEKLDPNIKCIYPIDFSIIKRPVSYDTESGKRKLDFAAGVFLLYKYTGPLTYINDFKEILQVIFKELKNSYFNKANEPLIIIGAELKYFNDF